MLESNLSADWAAENRGRTNVCASFSAFRTPRTMKIVDANAAPKAIGPYSQAIVVDGLLFTSGQIPLTPSGELVAGDIEAQTNRS
jgi:hypothetical protein